MDQKVELGAGGRHMPGWISVDISGNVDIFCDCSKERLPFPDNFATEVYHSHFLEHFSYPEPMKHVLSECLRILKPGGRMRAAVPDASIYIKAYVNKMPFPEVIPVYKPAFFFNSHIDSINYIAYMAREHHHMFDIDNLIKVLELADFINVAERKFDSDIDVEKRKPQSIYVTAYKNV